VRDLLLLLRFRLGFRLTPRETVYLITKYRLDG
jgi:hypothetical protein